MEKNSFVLYTDYKKHFDLLSDADKVKLLNAIFDYASGKEIKLDGAVEMAFSFIKAQMDRDNEKYERICEMRREYGSKGGLAKASKNKQKLAKASKSKQTLANVADNDTDNDTETDNDNDTDTENDTDNDKKSRAKAQRFTPPTIDEVKDYCWERNNHVDAQQFINFYESKGWYVGKNKMKDWKAAVRTWEQREQTIKPINNKPDNEFFRRMMNGG